MIVTYSISSYRIVSYRLVCYSKYSIVHCSIWYRVKYEKPSGGVPARCVRTANLRTKIMDFRGFDSHMILIVWDDTIMCHRELPGKSESTSLIREIGCTVTNDSA